MTKKEKLTQMANYVENRILANLSNEIYHDCKDELEYFKRLQIDYLTPAIKKAKKHFLDYNLAEINKREAMSKLNRISKLLAKWRDERKLTIESQQKNLKGNILEELTELARATNDEEKIDALCDICVFTINSSNESLELEYLLIMYNLNKDFYAFSMEILKYLELNEKNNIISLCFHNIKLLGYDWYKCMNETIKEISSRIGHYDEAIGKFIKDTSDEAKTKWYKADYSKCKLNND